MEAIKNHPNLPKNNRIESSPYNNIKDVQRIYFADPGEEITYDIRENNSIIVHNYDNKGRKRHY